MTKEELKTDESKYIIELVIKDKLKKEAEELYEDWYAHKLGAISIIDVICKMAEPREKRIAELEQENARLKEINTHTLSQLNLDNGELITQLTKAKDFIRNLKSLIEDVCDINYLSKYNTRLLVEAEQFLNSEVEK